MQKLRIIVSVISCLSGLLLISACSKQDLPVPPQPSPFSASLLKYTEFPTAGGKDTILIQGGTNGWWLTMPAGNWLVISKLYGSGDFKLPVEVKANNTGAPREINISVCATFGLPAINIKVKQPG